MGWKNGYYYRPGNRYAGTGEAAQLAAGIDRADAAADAATRASERRACDLAGAAYARQRAEAAQADRILEAGMEAAGYHRSGRHPWRRRQAGPGAARTAALLLAVELHRSRLAELVDRTLRSAAAWSPAGRGLARGLEQLRRRLVANSASPVVALVAELVAHSWLARELADATEARLECEASIVERRRRHAERRHGRDLATFDRIRRFESRPRHIA
jgi:hypothetical protein